MVVVIKDMQTDPLGDFELPRGSTNLPWSPTNKVIEADMARNRHTLISGVRSTDNHMKKYWLSETLNQNSIAYFKAKVKLKSPITGLGPYLRFGFMKYGKKDSYNQLTNDYDTIGMEFMVGSELGIAQVRVGIWDTNLGGPSSQVVDLTEPPFANRPWSYWYGRTFRVEFSLHQGDGFWPIPKTLVLEIYDDITNTLILNVSYVITFQVFEANCFGIANRSSTVATPSLISSLWDISYLEFGPGYIPPSPEKKRSGKIKKSQLLYWSKMAGTPIPKSIQEKLI